jgi:hypothetical protein
MTILGLTLIVGLAWFGWKAWRAYRSLVEQSRRPW